MQSTTSSQKRHKLEHELKVMYSTMNIQHEDKVNKGMKKNPKTFFSTARARQKTKTKVGPFLDPDSGILNLDPKFTTKVLSDQ